MEMTLDLLFTILELAGIFGGVIQVLVMIRGIIEQVCEMFAPLRKALA